jgi:imidazolonepropionase-like amidohydrolase
MKRLCLFLPLLTICHLVEAQSPAQAVRPVAFTHAVIIDGNGGAPIENGALVIRGDKIEAVGRAEEVQIPSGAQVLDLRGKALMPGLADMHVHLLGGWDGESVDMLGYRRYLNALLYSGVTTVLDTGNMKSYVIQLRDEIAAGRLLGPRIYCAGPLIDGPDPLWQPISYTISSVEQIPKVVRQLKADRVDILKLYVGLSNPMVFALAAEARKNSLPVFVDQSWRNGSPELAAAGITAFAHTPDFITGDEMIKMLKERGIMFISTLSVVESKSKRRLEDLAFLDYPLVRDTTPPDFIADIRAEAKRSQESKEWNSGPKQSNLRRFKQQSANLKRLFDAGLLFAAGTDAPYPGVFQGEGIHREMELVVEAGLRPLDAITMATRNAAQLIGAKDAWGTLQPGKLANLLVVNGRPDEKIPDTRNIELVMRLGKVLDREKLKLNPETDPGFRPVSPVSSVR